MNHGGQNGAQRGERGAGEHERRHCGHSWGDQHQAGGVIDFKKALVELAGPDRVGDRGARGAESSQQLQQGEAPGWVSPRVCLASSTLVIRRGASCRRAVSTELVPGVSWVLQVLCMSHVRTLSQHSYTMKWPEQS